MLSTPIWGIIADKLRARKKVSLFTSFVSSAILCLLAWPVVVEYVVLFLHLVSSEQNVRATTTPFSLCRDGFVPILAISLSMSMFVSSGVVDAYTLDTLGEKHRHRYGEIRLWAAVSLGLGAVGMGFLNDYIGGFSINFALVRRSARCGSASPSHSPLRRRLSSFHLHMHVVVCYSLSMVGLPSPRSSSPRSPFPPRPSPKRLSKLTRSDHSRALACTCICSVSCHFLLPGIH